MNLKDSFGFVISAPFSFYKTKIRIMYPLRCQYQSRIISYASKTPLIPSKPDTNVYGTKAVGREYIQKKKINSLISATLSIT